MIPEFLLEFFSVIPEHPQHILADEEELVVFLRRIDKKTSGCIFSNLSADIPESSEQDMPAFVFADPFQFCLGPNISPGPVVGPIRTDSLNTSVKNFPDGILNHFHVLFQNYFRGIVPVQFQIFFFRQSGKRRCILRVEKGSQGGRRSVRQIHHRIAGCTLNNHLKLFSAEIHPRPLLSAE